MNEEISKNAAEAQPSPQESPLPPRCDHFHAPEFAIPAQCSLPKGHEGLHIGGGGSWGTDSSDDVVSTEADAKLTREVALHAVTKFELKEAKAELERVKGERDTAIKELRDYKILMNY